MTDIFIVISNRIHKHNKATRVYQFYSPFLAALIYEQVS